MLRKNDCGVFQPTSFDASQYYAMRAISTGKHPEITRLETKFGVQVVEYLGREGISAMLRCADGSIMQAGISDEAAQSLRKTRKEHEIIVKRVIEHSPYVKDQWTIYEGNWRSCIYQELNGELLCSCGKKNCRHVQAVLDSDDWKERKTKKNILAYRRTTEGIAEVSRALRRYPSRILRKTFTDTPQNLRGDKETVELDESGMLDVQMTPIDIPLRKLDTETPADEIPEEPQKPTAFQQWVKGDYPVEDWLEDIYQRVENEDKLAKCVICGRILTNPVSVALEIGPECRERVKVPEYIEDETGLKVSVAVKNASLLYHEEKFRKWIVRAVLTLNAPPPVKILRSPWNKKEQYWGYKSKPILYYLDAEGKLNRVDTYRRKLRHRVIDKASIETELDAKALISVDNQR